MEPLLEVKIKAPVSCVSQSAEEAIDDYAVPIFDVKTTSYDLPECGDPDLLKLMRTCFALPLGILQLHNW